MYGFNKSHSAAYALVSYQTAYLKAHYPEEFMAGLLTLEMGDTDKTFKNIAECRERGIRILPPDVNESREDFTVLRPAPTTTACGRSASASAPCAASAARRSRRSSPRATPTGPFTSLAELLQARARQPLGRSSANGRGAEPAPSRAPAGRGEQEGDRVADQVRRLRLARRQSPPAPRRPRQGARAGAPRTPGRTTHTDRPVLAAGITVDAPEPALPPRRAVAGQGAAQGRARGARLLHHRPPAR